MKKIGFIEVLALVIGNMIGAGSYMMPTTLAKYGFYAVIGWAITSIGAIFLAVLFSKMFVLDPTEGGPYIYAQKKFGKFIGFQMALGYWLMCPIGSASLVISIISNLCVFFPSLETNTVLSVLISISIVGLFTYINLKGIHDALFVQVLVTILKLVPLIVFSVFSIFYFDTGKLFANKILITDISPWNAILSSASVTIWTFIGLESATIPNGIKTNIITKATILGVTITAVLYIVSLIGIMCIMPNQVLSESFSPFGDSTRTLFGGFLGNVMTIGSLICFIGSLNGWILIQGQVAYQASLSGLFPKIFQKHNKNGAPIYGIMIGSVIIIAMVLWQQSNTLSEQFEQTILLASFATLIPYIYFCAAAYITFYSSKTPNYNWMSISIIAFLFSICVMIGAGKDTIAIGSVVFLLISPLYIFVRQTKKNIK